MADIGSVSCDNVLHLGSLMPMDRIELYEVPGVAGGGLHDLGQSVGTARFRCLKRTDDSGDPVNTAAINTWSESIAALKGGGITTATDDRGISYSNLQIMDVSDLQIQDYDWGGTVYQHGTHIVSCLIME